jgi:acylphosphatase
VKRDVLARQYLVTGRVQGVGFRNYVEHLAGKLGLDGYVRNRRDGCVEVLAIGGEEQLRELFAALQKGPALSRVTSVQEQTTNPDARYRGSFTIEITI